MLIISFIHTVAREESTASDARVYTQAPLQGSLQGIGGKGLEADEKATLGQRTGTSKHCQSGRGY